MSGQVPGLGAVEVSSVQEKIAMTVWFSIQDYLLQNLIDGL